MSNATDQRTAENPVSIDAECSDLIRVSFSEIYADCVIAGGFIAKANQLRLLILSRPRPTDRERWYVKVIDTIETEGLLAAKTLIVETVKALQRDKTDFGV